MYDVLYTQIALFRIRRPTLNNKISIVLGSTVNVRFKPIRLFFILNCVKSFAL